MLSGDRAAQAALFGVETSLPYFLCLDRLDTQHTAEAVLRFALRSLIAEPAPGSARHHELTSLAIPDAHRHSK